MRPIGAFQAPHAYESTLIENLEYRCLWVRYAISMALSDQPTPLTLTEGDRDLLIASRAAQIAQQRADAQAKEGARLARRLLGAGLVISLIAIASFVILPSMGLYLPLTVPVVAFVAIALGALLTGKAEGVLPDPDEGARHGCGTGCAPGRPVGCCGPQPLRFRKPE